ncbi:MAG: hypothetical protein QJR08_03770 [Bacillota bacterium]|nr:hypothetical protein [Bacillota bacterium]
MRLADIRAQVRALILEPSAGFWSDAELTRYANDGLQDLTAVARAEAAFSAAVPAGSASVALPADFYAPWQAYWRNGRGDVTELLLIADSAVPTTAPGDPPALWAWDAASGQALLAPVPAAAGTLEMRYFRTLPELVADADEPAIPERWHRLLVSYAAAMALMKSGDSASDRHFQQYLQGRAAFERERLLLTERPRAAANYLDLAAAAAPSWPRPLRDDWS